MAASRKIPPIPPRKSDTAPPIPSIPVVPPVPSVEKRNLPQHETESFSTPTNWSEYFFGSDGKPCRHLLIYGLFVVIAITCFAVGIVLRSFLFLQIALVAAALFATSFLGGFVTYVVSLLGSIGFGLLCFAAAATGFGFIASVKNGAISKGILSFFAGGFGLLTGFLGLLFIVYGLFLLAPKQRRLFFEKSSIKISKMNRR